MLASVHNVETDVPPANVTATFEAGRECIYRSRKASVATQPRS